MAQPAEPSVPSALWEFQVALTCSTARESKQNKLVSGKRGRSMMAPHQSDFPSEQQAQLLQDIARDGNADSYGYGAEANDFDDLDPATLLESLANFEHPVPSSELPTVTEPPTLPEHPVSSERHFESLLQAAASADSQEAAQASRGQNKSPAKQPTATHQFGTPNNANGNTTITTTRKRKRKPRQVEDEESADDNFGFIVTKATRRKRRLRDTPEELAEEYEIWGSELEGDGDGDGSQLDGRTFSLERADPRAAGVHSAAALFRRPSAASKKYTRPPMSKLFTSLELHPEQFLRLQAAAKNYMLDERYPERSDCVGNRGKGDTDMTKIKLFGCVESFLVDDGWGEKCFGAKAPGAATRKLQWPSMKNKLISLITPLMRRMVTNERQRLYALETRKTRPQTSKSKKKARLGAPSPSLAPAIAPSLSPAIDPKLDNYHYNIDETFSPRKVQKSSTIQAQTTNDVPGKQLSTELVVDIPKKFLVNIMKGNRRIQPEATLDSCHNLCSLIQYSHAMVADENLEVGKVKVWGPSGTIDVSSEDDWKDAIAVIMDVEWINGEIKCIVEVEEGRR